MIQRSDDGSHGNPGTKLDSEASAQRHKRGPGSHNQLRIGSNLFVTNQALLRARVHSHVRPGESAAHRAVTVIYTIPSTCTWGDACL